ncbi:hypothetical protein [Microbispora sp. GKU 823]|uniref:hypothetical protein n=1 Tax=Microbispora sp. GKU 823 TaxID=1652100 RepID=UPI00211838DC|nr:hypothetical protein [Microbispora sp. GKU 823]
MRNSSTIGDRYENVGMICMTSSTGVTIRRTRGERPAQIPSGMPNSSDSTTADSVSASVSTLASQNPSTPRPPKPTSETSAIRQPPASQPRPAARPMSPGHPSATRAPWISAKTSAAPRRM